MELSSTRSKEFVRNRNPSGGPGGGLAGLSDRKREREREREKERERRIERVDTVESLTQAEKERKRYFYNGGLSGV